MQGYPDDRFRPDAPVTRYEAAVTLSRLIERILYEKATNDPLISEVMTSPASGQITMPFTDVPTDHWAYEDVIKLENLGMLAGFPDSKFCGDEPVTQNDLISVLSRFLAVIRISSYPDQQSTNNRDQYSNEDAIDLLESIFTRTEFQDATDVTRLEFSFLLAYVWDLFAANLEADSWSDS